jgi:hypothetical protein
MPAKDATAHPLLTMDFQMDLERCLRDPFIGRERMRLGARGSMNCLQGCTSLEVRIRPERTKCMIYACSRIYDSGM